MVGMKRMQGTNSNAAMAVHVLRCPITGLPIMPLWPVRVGSSPQLWSLLGFLAFVLGGIAFFCGPQVSVKIASPDAFTIAMAECALVTTVFYLLRRKLDDAFRNSKARLSLTLPLLADAVLIILLTAILPAIDAQFFSVEQSLRELAKATTYHALIVFLFSTRFRLQSAIEAAPPAQPNPRTVQIASGLQFVEAEGHYVKLVYLDRVEHRKARFRDVIASLESAGLQVQKSFWVNRSAVATVRRCGRRLKMVLNDGAQIPVGRNKERVVLQAFPDLRVRQRSN